MKVERIELPKELTVESAKRFIGHIASVCTGKKLTDEDAERVGDINLREDGGGPTRAWEFLPVTLTGGRYQNFREGLTHLPDKLRMLIAQYNMDNNTNFMGDGKLRTDFHIFKVTVPRMVAAHLKTHTTLSSLMSSVRIGCNDGKEYWFPPVEKEDQGINGSEYLLSNNGTFFYYKRTHSQFRDILNRNYKRKEITKRPLSDFELVDMHIVGYQEKWDKFFKTRKKRDCDPCTADCKKRCIQDETAEVALMIKELIYGTRK